MPHHHILHEVGFFRRAQLRAGVIAGLIPSWLLMALSLALCLLAVNAALLLGLAESVSPGWPQSLHWPASAAVIFFMSLLGVIGSAPALFDELQKTAPKTIFLVALTTASLFGAALVLGPAPAAYLTDRDASAYLLMALALIGIAVPLGLFTIADHVHWAMAGRAGHAAPRFGIREAARHFMRRVDALAVPDASTLSALEREAVASAAPRAPKRARCASRL